MDISFELKQQHFTGSIYRIFSPLCENKLRSSLKITRHLHSCEIPPPFSFELQRSASLDTLLDKYLRNHLSLSCLSVFLLQLILKVILSSKRELLKVSSTSGNRSICQMKRKNMRQY